MNEYKYLRKKAEEGEKKGLLQSKHDETTPEEAKAILERMKEISDLIRDVRIAFPPFKISDLILYREQLLSLDKSTSSYSSS